MNARIYQQISSVSKGKVGLHNRIAMASNRCVNYKLFSSVCECSLFPSYQEGYSQTLQGALILISNV